MHLDIDDRCRMILVMGAQRSGTTALFESLAQDPQLQAEDETAGWPFYRDFRLRSLAEIEPVLRGVQQTLLLKPVAELHDRSLQSVVEEFLGLNPRVAWIYRDPWANALSARRLWNWPAEHIDRWVDFWLRANQSALDFLQGPLGERMAIVRYEELMRHPDVFAQLGGVLDVRPGSSLFVDNPVRIDAEIREGARERIQQRTSAVLAELDRHRIVPLPKYHFVGSNLSNDGMNVVIENHCGALANLVTNTEGGFSVRIDELPKRWLGSVRVMSEPFEVEAGQTYEVTLRARGDQSRSLGMGVGAAFGPDEPLELYQDLELSAERCEFTETFVPATTGRVQACLFIGNQPEPIHVENWTIRAIPKPRWSVRCSPGARARVQSPIPTGSTAIIEIQSPGMRHDAITAAYSLPPIRAKKRYRVSLVARGMDQRTISFGVVGEPASRDVGIFRVLPLDAHSRSFTFRFVATRSCATPHLLVQVGGSSIAVEVGQARLEEMPHWMSADASMVEEDVYSEPADLTCRHDPLTP